MVIVCPCNAFSIDTRPALTFWSKLHQLPRYVAPDVKFPVTVGMRFASDINITIVINIITIIIVVRVMVVCRPHYTQFLYYL